MLLLHRPGRERPKLNQSIPALPQGLGQVAYLEHQSASHAPPCYPLQPRGFQPLALAASQFLPTEQQMGAENGPRLAVLRFLSLHFKKIRHKR